MNTKEFIQFFEANPPSFLKDENCKMRVQGKVYDYSDQTSLSKLLNTDIVLQYGLIDWHKSNDSDKMEFAKNFIEGTYRQDRAARIEKRETFSNLIDDDLELPDIDYVLKTLRPCRIVGDLRKEGGFKFLDKDTGKLTDFDYHSIALVVSREMDEKFFKQYMERSIFIQSVYDPHGEAKVTLLDEKTKVYQINEYRPPAWKAIYADITPTLDPDIEKLLVHLFPEEKCREFVFNWIYHSLTSRAGTYLYLCGGQGSGKNTLANLLMNMHGKENSSSPKQGAIKSQFNHYLKNKCLVFFDEFNCRVRTDKDTLKSIINDLIQIEGKHKDHEDVEVHSSYIIANNSHEAIGLDPIDRRFSVPNITDESIIRTHGRDFMRELTIKINDPKILGEFAKYVIETYKVPKYFPDEPYQHERYEDIVITTARMGLKETLDRILAKEEETYSYREEFDIHERRKSRFKFPGYVEWSTFFKEVRYKGKPLGTVKNYVFTPRKDLVVEVENSGDLV